MEESQLLEVRFADKKRKDNIPLSMIPPGLLTGGATAGGNMGLHNGLHGYMDPMQQMMHQQMTAGNHFPPNFSS